MSCMVIGDSIAVGVAQQRHDCAVYARVGITSAGWNNKFQRVNLTSDTVIISIGSNDKRSVDTLKEIEIIRDRITASTVIWILPASSKTRPLIEAFAASRNDVVLSIPNVSKDKVHPTKAGYQRLAQLTKQE